MKCMLDTVGYNSKPTTKAGEITKRIADLEVEITLEELLNSILAGKTFKPAVVGRTENDWVEQQLFALDFDDNVTIEQIKEKCANLGVLPAFGYTSFSHTEEKHKFRLIFANNEIITDYDTAKMTQLCLMQIFNECDKQCKNLNRFYYGGISEIKFDMNNRINAIELIEKYKEQIEYSSTDIIKKGYTTKVTNDKYTKGDKVDGHSNGIITIPIICPSMLSYDESNLHYIRERDVKSLKNKLNRVEITFETDGEFFEYIRKQINIGELLEIPYPTSFKCILHKDDNNSAGIFQNEEGVYLYKCFGENCKYSNKALNTITLIEAICNFNTRQKTYEFIKEVFNLKIQETDFQKRQKDILSDIESSILNNNRTQDGLTEFVAYCPQTDKNLRYAKDLFLTMIRIAKDNIYDEEYTDKDGNVIFFASLGYILSQSASKSVSDLKIAQRLAALTYHRLIRKLDDGEIPERLLKRSQGYAIHNKNGGNKRINWYSIPAFVINHFIDIEQQGVKWKGYGYTLTGVSREMFYRNEGSEIADWIYPQNKYRIDKSTGEILATTTTRLSDERTLAIEKCLVGYLKDKGYCIERDLLRDIMKEHNCKEDVVKRQLKKVQAQLISKHNLIRLKSGKAIKEQYNIDSDGYPFIFIKA
jgi:hypothetical protein